MKKVKIDQEKCIGCGTCVALCSEGFELAKNGKAKVRDSQADCDFEEVIRSCPTRAISR